VGVEDLERIRTWPDPSSKIAEAEFLRFGLFQNFVALWRAGGRHVSTSLSVGHSCLLRQLMRIARPHHHPLIPCPRCISLPTLPRFPTRVMSTTMTSVESADYPIQKLSHFPDKWPYSADDFHRGDEAPVPSPTTSGS